MGAASSDLDKQLVLELHGLIKALCQRQPFFYCSDHRGRRGVGLARKQPHGCDAWCPSSHEAHQCRDTVSNNNRFLGTASEDKSPSEDLISPKDIDGRLCECVCV